MGYFRHCRNSSRSFVAREEMTWYNIAVDTLNYAGGVDGIRIVKELI